MKPKRRKPGTRIAPGRARQTPQLVLEGRVRDVTDMGDSVVETDHGIVFVTGALPGERVRVRTEHTRAGATYGSLLAVLSAAPDRIEPACHISARCGGCPLMTLDITAQRQHKQRRVERALTGLSDVALPVHFESLGPALGYRRRARLGFRKLASALIVGYHRHGSHQLIDVARCPVLTPQLEAALSTVRTLLGPMLTGAGAIELDELDDDRVAVAVHCEDALPSEAYRAAERLASQQPITAVELRIDAGAPARFGEPARTRIGRDGLPISAPRHGFSQVNAAVNVRLGEIALELAEPMAARVLELYAGHGNFTLPLAERAAALLAVEGDARAAQACRENLHARARTQARVLVADVRELTLCEPCDVLVLDPPRGGCPSLARLVAQTRPTRVVYISCHMTTLQRDLRALHAAGYRADRAHALDMFPQTGHVEAVVRMQVERTRSARSAHEPKQQR